MEKIVVGREKEKEILTGLLEAQEPHLVAILGRRRVGKTYLVRSFYKEQMVFECSGEIDGTTSAQLYNFTKRLSAHFKLSFAAPPTSWQQAFQLLEQGLATLKHNRKKVLFFDELPWLDTHRSGFLGAFGYWWNMYASKRSDMLVVICGSAASWMINKVVNNRGGLHNRITQRITLLPFTLHETGAYLQYKKVKLTQYQIVQLYMAFGGIPHYLNAVAPGQSVAQIINAACFSKDGVLHKEFDNLYAALFSRPEKHIQLVKILAAKSGGLTRTEIVEASKKVQSGGGLTKALDELAESGFVDKSYPFGKKVKETVYRLADEFTIFYLRFIARQSTEAKDWTKILPTNAFTVWSGYAFESVCLKHIAQIKQALGIAAVYTEQSAWRWKGDASLGGAQIDLLIDRADGCINLCEIKFAEAPYVITKKYAAELLRKEQAFRMKTTSRKALFTTIISPYGVFDNEYRVQRVQSQITLQHLFG